jgi:hypothetical protein
MNIYILNKFMRLHELKTNDNVKKSRRMKIIITEAQFKKLTDNTLIESVLGKFQKIKLVKVEN